MAKQSNIEWTDSTWNPWRGCTKVSAGCKHCYAERRAKWTGEEFNNLVRSKTTLRDPIKWAGRQMIFVCSLSDFFHPDVPSEWRDEAWEIMYHCRSQHTFLLLTKRPENIASMLPTKWIEGMHKYWPHIWIGVSAENQEEAEKRIPLLMEVPAAVRFVSAEPLLGPIDFIPYMIGGGTREFTEYVTRDMAMDAGEPSMEGMPIHHEYTEAYQLENGIRWVIVGGESDRRDARPLDLEWIRDIRDQCHAGGASVFVKQLGTQWANESGSADWKGGLMADWPDDLKVREFPDGQD